MSRSHTFTSPHSAQPAQEYLDRLALSLGGKAVSDAAAPLLGSWLQDAQWQKRAAVFICLAQIAEGCQKVGREEERRGNAHLITQEGVQVFRVECVEHLADTYCRGPLKGGVGG